MKQDIEYNEILASSLGLIVQSEISIPSPAANYQEYKIPGMDGTLVETDGTYENIKINAVFNYQERKNWGSTYRSAKKWLNSSGSRILKLFRTDQTFYKVKTVEIGEEQRANSFAASFEVTFTCDPYTYLESGLEQISGGNVYNPEEISHPTYLITGNGQCTLTVNGNTTTATIGQNLTIDTDRMIAYREDGTMANTSVTGDYDYLYLLPGENTISITSGFLLKIIPNWRHL